MDLHTSLKRAKVIFQEVGNEELNQWLKNEIGGYKNLEDVPPYRKIKGELKGCYIEGMANYTNALISLDNIDEETAEGLMCCSAGQSIYALQEAIKANHSFARRFNAQECTWLSAKTGREIYAAEVAIDVSAVVNILSTVENLLLDTFLLLEKEFGILDDLDIDLDKKTEDEKQVIAEKIVIILQDNSVTIGEKSKIKDSTIASSIRNKAIR